MDLADHTSARVAQASLMIAVQVPCERDEAIQRLGIRASGLRQSIEDTALDVLDGLLRFDGLPPFDAPEPDCPECRAPMRTFESDESRHPSTDPCQPSRAVYFCPQCGFVEWRAESN
jgi:uncharacterized protein with PIN domain